MKPNDMAGTTEAIAARVHVQMRAMEPARIHIPPAVFAAAAQLYALKYKHSDTDIRAWGVTINDAGWKFVVPGSMVGNYTLDGPVYFNSNEMENVIGLAEAYYEGVIDESV